MIKHPGQILFNDFMTPLGITSSHLATNLGVNRSTIGRLIATEHRITSEMAARLGAYFGVPARWWLLMQAEFDAQDVLARPELSEGVCPMEPNSDILFTPNGVLRLDAPESVEVEPPPSFPIETLEKLPQGSPSKRREVQIVRYENGSVALVGDAT